MKAVFAVLLLSACSFAGAGGSNGGPDGNPRADAPPSDPNDVDSDGKPNNQDNCPATANADQADGDGDGVGEACDNCPTVANPRLLTMGEMVQRDHDLDGRGDACDLCPHIASASDLDSDGDGIGMACDPNDGEKNRPAEFDGFYDPPSNSRWVIPSTDAGQFSDWKLEQTADKRIWWTQTSADTKRHQLIRNRPDIGEVYVESAFRIHTFAAGAGADVLRAAGVTYGYFRQSNTDFYFVCGLRHNTSTNSTTGASTAYTDDTFRASESSEMPWSGALAERDVQALGVSTRVTRGGPGGDSRMNCNALASDPTASAAPISNSQFFPDGKVGLRTYGMTASFDYIFIVDRTEIP
jgi:hypothetical protein